MSKSQNAKLTPLPISAVRLSKDSFWRKYQQAICKKSIPTLFNLFEDKGVIDNFRRLTGRKKCDRRGPRYTDSDIYKWMEGAAWSLAVHQNPVIRRQLETAITEILPAQCSDGYLNTFYTDHAARFTNPDGHEMYCAGHYFQAAVAIYRSLNDDRILKSAIKFADYLYDQFGPGKPRKWACGHPEIELALVELYRTTGDKKYLDFSRHILNQINPVGTWYKPEITHDKEVPFEDRKEFFGHAVRNLYMASAGSDLWAETGDQKIGRAVNRLWENLINRKIYITGGVGSRQQGEIIGLNYELPNLLAYAETCAAIANIFWNHRNLQITAEARFSDWLERSLYNGTISGFSLDYTHYFYENPLASFGDRNRQEWFECTCCPSNIVRLLASITGYFYSSGSDGLWVHLYDSNVVQFRDTEIIQKTGYPFDGRITFTFKMKKDTSFALNLRIPGWAENFSVKINNRPMKVKMEPGRYLALNRIWQNNDTATLELKMPVQPIVSHPHAIDNFHRVALMRGPLVYCLESTDNPGLTSVHLAALKPNLISKAKIVPGKGFYKQSIPAIILPGLLIRPENTLYRPIRKYDIKSKPVTLTAIPYYAWANRGKNSQMTVWIPA